jgi:hypothetical protein
MVAERFNVHYNLATLAHTPVIAPWRKIELDPRYAGEWVVFGDVDGDGEAEIVSARNVDENDVHYTSAVVVHKLDGSVLWRWGGPDLGRAKLHHDVACQLYDWDGDGKLEVVISTADAVLELEGATGREKRRLPLPPQAADCLVFCNLTGGPHATDVLVKDRYSRIWAYSREWQPLWQVENPGGYRTAHRPLPIDVDGDGRDEIMAGYTLLNADGTERWTLRSEQVDLAGAHLDCTRIVHAGERPKDWRLVHSYCGAGAIAMTDAAGNTLWEVCGQHYESLDVGKVRADVPGLQFLVDVDHLEPGKNPTCLFDENGDQLGQYTTTYSRFHGLVDWDGDGLQEIVLADVPVICDGHGVAIARLDFDDIQERYLRIGDFDGDGAPDISIHTSAQLHLFRNPCACKPAQPVPLGTEMNATLY